MQGVDAFVSAMLPVVENWGGTYRYLADEVAVPGSIDELAAVLSSNERVRIVGTRHTFTGITDASTMVSLSGLGERFEIGPDRSTVTIDGSMTYSRLISLLAPHALAVPNLASLPHLCVAGAVATATHGSGDDRGNLATAVAGIELVTPTGEVVERRRGDVDFDGLVVGLGCFGAVTALTLDLEPATEMAQTVHLALPIGDVADAVDEVFASGDSVSLFTRWRGVIDQAWIKRRTDSARPVADVVEAAARADRPVHVVPGSDPAHCTEQLGRPGPWSERLPHFRADAIPNTGHELQTEYFVPRASARAAILALDRIGPELTPLLTGELRTVAADSLWLSPHCGRDSLAFHFTWEPDVTAVEEASGAVEAALDPFEPRPHWGKVFTPGHSLEAPTPRRDDAIELMHRLDPNGVMANDWAVAEGLRSR
ncbi:MAG: FAD-binding protein [Actinomycetota bacterium]